MNAPLLQRRGAIQKTSRGNGALLVVVCKALFLDVVGRLLEPSLWNRLETASDFCEQWRLQNVGGNNKLDHRSTISQVCNLKIRVLGSLLVRRLVLPTLRVSVADKFRSRVSFLSANLTNLGHCSNPLASQRRE